MTSAERGKSGRVRLRTGATLTVPAGTSAADACTGRITIVVKRHGKPAGRQATGIDADCAFTTSSRLKRSKLRHARKLTLLVGFSGNAVFNASKARVPLKVG